MNLLFSCWKPSNKYRGVLNLSKQLPRSGLIQYLTSMNSHSDHFSVEKLLSKGKIRNYQGLKTICKLFF